MIAVTLLSAAGAGMYTGTVTGVATGLTAAIFLIGPMTWWFYKSARINSNQRPANIFYENGVSPDEVERIQNIDAMECVAFEMLT